MGYSESQIDQYFQMSGDMSVTKTQGKKSVGGINRMVMDAQYFDKKLEKACNIFKDGELDENSVCAKFAQTADDGKTYNYKFYSLAAIIAVGYRINSERATQFRTWATKVLDTFTKQGYVLDKSRLINGQIFDEDYFEHLIAEIQEIIASERKFYQKITDIYATAVDYDKNSQVTRAFYITTLIN